MSCSSMTRVIRPVTALQNASQGFSGSLALFERIFAVLDLPAPGAAAPGAPPLRVSRGAVEVDDVTVRYDSAEQPACDYEPRWADHARLPYRLPGNGSFPRGLQPPGPRLRA